MTTAADVPAPSLADLLDTEALARLTGTRANYWAKARIAGSGPPFVKIGRFVRYNRSAVERWLQARHFQSTAAADAARAIRDT